MPAAIDLLSARAGGKVVMVSSMDEEHPGDNIIDGDDSSYWISTGLYPQEILIELAQPARISNMRLAATSVRSVRVEACAEETPVNFKPVAEGELQDNTGRLQLKDLPCRDHGDVTRFVKLMIMAGWDDFCSVHQVTAMP